jgi:hypothetical protein
MSRFLLFLLPLLMPLFIKADIIIYNPSFLNTGTIYISINGGEKFELQPNYKYVHNWEGYDTQRVTVSGDVNRTFDINPTAEDIYLRVLRDVGVLAPSIITGIAIVDKETGREEVAGLIDNSRYDEFQEGLRLGAGLLSTFDGDLGLGPTVNIEYLFNSRIALQLANAFVFESNNDYTDNIEYEMFSLYTSALVFYRFDRAVLGYITPRIGIGLGYMTGSGENINSESSQFNDEFEMQGFSYIADLGLETNGPWNTTFIYGFQVSYDDLDFEDIGSSNPDLVDYNIGPDFRLYAQLYFNLSDIINQMNSRNASFPIR